MPQKKERAGCRGWLWPTSPFWTPAVSELALELVRRQRAGGRDILLRYPLRTSMLWLFGPIKAGLHLTYVQTHLKRRLDFGGPPRRQSCLDDWKCVQQEAKVSEALVSFWTWTEDRETMQKVRQAVKCLRCSTCEKKSRSRSDRPSRTPTGGERFNDRLFMDLCDVRGNRYWWLVAVGQHTDYTVIAPCPSHESQAVATKIFKHWIRWAGPLTSESEAWELLRSSLKNSQCQELRCKITAAYSPWQKGRVEQRIATIKEVAGKSILQHHAAKRHVVCRLRGCPRTESKSREVGHLPATRLFVQRMKVYGELMEHEEVVPHPKVLDEVDELARRFIFRASARVALEVHAASEAIRRAASTRSRSVFLTNTTQANERTQRGRYLGRAALVGPHGRTSWWVRFGGRAYLCAAQRLPGVTPDEADCLGLDGRRQLDELLQADREVPENYKDLTSQFGPSPSVEVPTDPTGEPAEPSRDDWDIGTEAFEPVTPLEEARETEASTEVGEQSISWRRLEENLGQQNQTEIPYEETGGSPQFKGARLESRLKTNRRELVRTKQNQSVPRTCSWRRNGDSSTASSIMDKHQYDREVSFHKIPEADVSLYQGAERVQWDEWVTHGSVKNSFTSWGRRDSSASSRERRLHSRFAHRKENAGLLDLAGNPLPVKAKARMVIQGQHCPDNAQGLVRTNAPTVHRTAVSVCFQLVSSMGWCRSVRGVDDSCAWSKLWRGFWTTRFSLGMLERTDSKETPGHLSKWTLPSSACVTFLDISSEWSS